jgi:hypothetical protein
MAPASRILNSTLSHYHPSLLHLKDSMVGILISVLWVWVWLGLVVVWALELIVQPRLAYSMELWLAP